MMKRTGWKLGEGGTLEDKASLEEGDEDDESQAEDTADVIVSRGHATSAAHQSGSPRESSSTPQPSTQIGSRRQNRRRGNNAAFRRSLFDSSEIRTLKLDERAESLKLFAADCIAQQLRRFSPDETGFEPLNDEKMELALEQLEGEFPTVLPFWMWPSFLRINLKWRLDP
jgi:hypothetical protein